MSNPVIVELSCADIEHRVLAEAMASSTTSGAVIVVPTKSRADDMQRRVSEWINKADTPEERTRRKGLALGLSFSVGVAATPIIDAQSPTTEERHMDNTSSFDEKRSSVFGDIQALLAIAGAMSVTEVDRRRARYTTPECADVRWPETRIGHDPVAAAKYRSERLERKRIAREKREGKK